MSVIFSALRYFTPRAIVSNLARTAASEYEQGVIRVIILVMVLSFLYYQVHQDGWVYPFDLLIPVLGGLVTYYRDIGPPVTSGCASAAGPARSARRFSSWLSRVIP